MLTLDVWPRWLMSFKTWDLVRNMVQLIPIQPDKYIVGLRNLELALVTAMKLGQLSNLKGPNVVG